MILFLGPSKNPLLSWLVKQGESMIQTDKKINPAYIRRYDITFIVSYGYRHIIKEDVLNMVQGVNLHISYLPWNRGADPNLWSYIDGTPKGVTIHYLDTGLDTGDIIAQWEIEPYGETLAETYVDLQAEIKILFILNWDKIKRRTAGIKQTGKGTYHQVKDRVILANGWDTEIKTLPRRVRPGKEIT